MKFSKLSQLFLVSSIGLVVATLLTACSITTIDYVFVACTGGTGSSTDGSIESYAVDSESGALRSISTAVSSGGENPTAMAVSTDYANLYVANQTSGTITHFAIANNGGLTLKDTLTLGATPVALTVNTAGTYLYVASCTSTGVSPTVTCTAGTAQLTEYALSSGTIGAQTADEPLALTGTYSGDTIAPTGIAVMSNTSSIPGNGVFVTAYDQSAYNPTGTTSSQNPQPGWVFGFSVSGGTLTAALNSPYSAGVKPSAIIVDPTNMYAYVTDYESNALIGYTILDNTTTSIHLNFLTSGPFSAGTDPIAVTIDPRGKFMYVANALSNSVSAYEITLANGTPTAVVNTTGSSVNSTNARPVAIAVDPALGRYLYTVNYTDNSLSGFRLDSTAGTLAATQSTPYPTGSDPTALVIVPHGNHSTQVVAQ
jgi:6-phosphogluconolactonase (cycloisomerase 2 family)